MISERVSVEFIHGDALFYELLQKSGQEGERLNVWQEGDIPEIFFREDHVSDGNPCFRSERK